MKEKKQSKFPILKIIVIAFSVINLAALFIFHYELPDFLTFKLSEAKVEESVSEESDILEVTSNTYSIQFETDTLTYDGSSDLDLLSGVSIVAPDGSTSDAEIFAHIVTGDSLTEKNITYSADTSEGQITATRTLVLQNYKGPSITLPEELPALTEDELGNLLQYMPADGTFLADDGFGNDITSSVFVEYTIDSSNPSLVHYVFTVTNLFNDTTSVSMDLKINSDRPILTLKQKTVTIEKGSSFQALGYVERAEDAEGNSLFHRISISGEVDVNTAGEYTLTYTATTTEGKSSVPQTLTITVE